jgi:hypothetical protein
MSDASADFDLREQLARIDRARAETEKLSEETRKFVAEAHKLAAERDKLAAEARKLDRDRLLAPWQVAVVTLGGLAALVGGLLTIVKTLHP